MELCDKQTKTRRMGFETVLNFCHVLDYIMLLKKEVSVSNL